MLGGWCHSLIVYAFQAIRDIRLHNDENLPSVNDLYNE
jgi:hypothetical protein